MSEFKSVLTAPIARPAQEITLPCHNEDISDTYTPKGWTSNFATAEDMGIIQIKANLTGKNVRLIVNDYDSGEWAPDEFDDDLSLLPPDELSLDDLEPHQMGRIYLVKPELAQQGIDAGSFNLVGVEDGVVRMVNLTTTPIDVMIEPIGAIEDPFNPYANLSIPYIERLGSNPWSDSYLLHNLPPVMESTVYLVDFMTAAIAREAGRLDFLPIRQLI